MWEDGTTPFNTMFSASKAATSDVTHIQIDKNWVPVPSLLYSHTFMTVTDKNSSSQRSCRSPRAAEHAGQQCMQCSPSAVCVIIRHLTVNIQFFSTIIMHMARFVWRPCRVGWVLGVACDFGAPLHTWVMHCNSP